MSLVKFLKSKEVELIESEADSEAAKAGKK